MIDVRLTATNPEDSSLVPVPCNTRGELLTVAPKIELIPNDVEIEGDLWVAGTINGSATPGEQGPPGPPGPPGAPGADGGDFPLPPDPYEGALLGWLNNELAWIGSPPVPVPPGVFGPIVGWDPAGLLLVDGEIPEQVKQGVYVYQCNEDGSIFVDGWNNSQKWSDGMSTDGTFLSSTPKTQAYDAFTSTYCDTEEQAKTITTLMNGLSYSSQVEVFCRNFNVNASINGGALVTVSGNDTNWEWRQVVSGQGNIQRLDIVGTTSYEGFAAVRVDGLVLADKGSYPEAPNLNLRVQSVNGQNLIGSANRTENFTPGKYLRIPQQNVARWLYDGTLNKLITTTGINNPRLT